MQKSELIQAATNDNYKPIKKYLQQMTGNVIKQKGEAEEIVNNCEKLLDIIVDARIALESFDLYDAQEKEETRKLVRDLLEGLNEN